MEIIVDSVSQTLELGKRLGTNLFPGAIVCITGDLGTGKTHITKGIAKGLNIDEPITSPTFTIVNEYHSGTHILYHFDVYRVNDPDEIYAIGFDEYIFGEGVSVIEWANYIEELIPKKFIHIKLTKVLEKGDNYRKITITPYGEEYEKLIKAIN